MPGGQFRQVVANLDYTCAIYAECNGKVQKKIVKIFFWAEKYNFFLVLTWILHALSMLNAAMNMFIMIITIYYYYYYHYCLVTIISITILVLLFSKVIYDYFIG